MKENRRTTNGISEAARELGISIEWLRKGEARGFFLPHATAMATATLQKKTCSACATGPHPAGRGNLRESLPKSVGGESGGSETVGDRPKIVSDSP
jgi:hypothetical protein